VTLRELLSHTAGTNIQGFPDYVAGAPVPTTLQVLDGAPPATNPPVRVNTDGPTGAPHRAHHPRRPICTKAICRHLYDEPVVFLRRKPSKRQAIHPRQRPTSA
jgi:hypothetical protein